MHVGRSGTPACGEVGSCRRLPRQRHERSGERAKPQLDEVPQTLVAAGACCDATMPARHLGEFPRRLFQEILGRFFLPRIFAKIFAKSRFAKSVFAKDFCQDFWQKLSWVSGSSPTGLCNGRFPLHRKFPGEIRAPTKQPTPSVCVCVCVRVRAP